MALSRLNYYTACSGLVGVGFILIHSNISSRRQVGLFSHLATSCLSDTASLRMVPGYTTHSAGHSKATAATCERRVPMGATTLLHCAVNGSKHSTLLKEVWV
jgi:hypothetical protein